MTVSQFKAKKATIFHLKKRYAFSGYGHYLFFVVSVTTYFVIKKILQKMKQMFLLLLSCFMQLQVSTIISPIRLSYN